MVAGRLWWISPRHSAPRSCTRAHVCDPIRRPKATNPSHRRVPECSTRRRPPLLRIDINYELPPLAASFSSFPLISLLPPPSPSLSALSTYLSIRFNLMLLGFWTLARNRARIRRWPREDVGLRTLAWDMETRKIYQVQYCKKKAEESPSSNATL